jgi:arylsulfatase A-like enzyme
MIHKEQMMRQSSRREFLKWTGAVAALAALPRWLAAAEAARERPNIVYILADDMGYADGGFMGCRDIQTPNLDRLAQGAAVLTSFYVQPLCSPTRSCFMTGRYVAHTGVYTVVKPNATWGLPLEERTLAAALREEKVGTLPILFLE